MVYRRSFEDYFLDIFSYVFLVLFAVAALFPFINVLSKALSEEWAVVSGKVTLFPVGFQLDSMKYVISSVQFLNSFKNSVFVTVCGTLLSILLTSVTAYPLSKKHMFGIRQILVLFVFTMLFKGGIIPNFLLVKKLGLINHLGALIFPGALSVFNLLVIKNYYESLPESLEESARLDGASSLVILFKIILPLSAPVLATVSLFYAVGYWNNFLSPMMYISKPALKPLQLYLRDIVLEADNSFVAKSIDELMNISPESIRAATIIASTIPVLLVYPYLQKYFIKGILIGSVKG